MLMSKAIHAQGGSMRPAFVQPNLLNHSQREWLTSKVKVRVTLGEISPLQGINKLLYPVRHVAPNENDDTGMRRVIECNLLVSGKLAGLGWSKSNDIRDRKSRELVVAAAVLGCEI
jgi:hypothetical protein